MHKCIDQLINAPEEDGSLPFFRPTRHLAMSFHGLSSIVLALRLSGLSKRVFQQFPTIVYRPMQSAPPYQP